MYQILILVGRVGSDPEMHYLPTGTSVTSFPVLITRRFTSPEGQVQDETLWFRVAIFGKPAELCSRYLTKRKRVLVEGRLLGDKTGGPRIWTGSDGLPRSAFEVLANQVRFLDLPDRTRSRCKEAN